MKRARTDSGCNIILFQISWTSRSQLIRFPIPFDPSDH